MVRNTTAQEFLSKFMQIYRESAAHFSNAELSEIWTNNWNGLIIGRSMSPPAPLTRSVWKATAESLGFEYWDGEPLRLDGVFHAAAEPNQILHFPIRVALEHEYVAANFSEEITKLLSIRCPLKVGMIYYDKGDKHRRLTATEEEIRKYSETISVVSGEDGKTEYLFVAGLVQREPFYIDWNALTFSAAEGPSNSHFISLQP